MPGGCTSTPMKSVPGEPVASSTPNNSRASSLVSRRETRLRTASVTTAACNLGPNADRGSPRLKLSRPAPPDGTASGCRKA